MTRTSPRWEDPRTVAGFVSGAPNAVLLAFAERIAAASTAFPPRCLDIGCGAARNAVALSEIGYDVAAIDLSEPMLTGARDRLRAHPGSAAVRLALAPMAPLPFPDDTFDLIVAHGIWNLSRTDVEFRAALREAGRVARSGAGLFVFTFSRHTLPDDAQPESGSNYVFSSWNGEPQCFVREDELTDELRRAGFARTGTEPMTEYNRAKPGQPRAGGAPVIYEATFTRLAR